MKKSDVIEQKKEQKNTIMCDALMRALNRNY